MSEQTIAGVTRTICSLFGIDCPDRILEVPFASVIEEVKALGIDRFERILLYAPDAVGLHLCEAFPEVIGPVARKASTVVRMKSVVPPVIESSTTSQRNTTRK